MFAWILIIMMVLLLIASVKVFVSGCNQIYSKLSRSHSIPKNRGPWNKSIQV